MLILARRPGERVVIGDEILVTVMEVSGSTVRLGIAAPQGISIYREEIWIAVKEENRAAATAQADALPSEPMADTLPSTPTIDTPPSGSPTEKLHSESATDIPPSGPVGEDAQDS
jgi:carbon storage regulator